MVVETALALFVFFSLIIALIDLGRIFHTQSKLLHAVSQSTRFATTGNVLEDPMHPGEFLSREASIVQMIEKLSDIADFEPSDIEILTVNGPDDFTPGAGGPGDVVAVRVTYRLELISPFLHPLFPDGVFQFRCSTTFRNEEFVAALDEVEIGRPTETVT